MKVIISHDVDHLTAWEHIFDLYLTKFLILGSIELLYGSISFREYLGRFATIFLNRLENLPELMRFDRENGVPSTFFIAMGHGKSLNYSRNRATKWLKEIRRRGFAVGLHGTELNSKVKMGVERDHFRCEMDGHFGIRIHNIGPQGKGLQVTEGVISIFADLGYRFSSNRFIWGNPEKVGDIWDFPIHLSENDLFSETGRWKTSGKAQAIEKTVALLERGKNDGIQYLQVSLHDCYFSNNYRDIKEWYEWFISYLKGKNIILIDFEGALRELDGISTVR